MMDVDRLAMHVEAKDGDKQQKLAYMKQVGAASSAFEHAVPERLFADPSKPLDDPSQPQGISAVKAIAIAAAQGQKIYTLTAHNAAYHANILASLDTNENTKTEIRNALSAGMDVTVHQADITVNGWTGSGYIILDPETGAGAYKISGGANGAWFSGFLAGVSIGAVLTIIGIGAGALVGGTYELLIFGGAALLLTVFIMTVQALALAYIIDYYSGDNTALGCLTSGVATGIGFTSFGAGWLIGQIVNFIFGVKLSSNNLLSCT
ncbi:MAG: hypothetical protein AB1717_02735 [Pseudomonadota bacterium]